MGKKVGNLFCGKIGRILSVALVAVGFIGCILCDLALCEIDPLSIFINGICFTLVGIFMLILAFTVPPTNPKQKTSNKQKNKTNGLNNSNTTYFTSNLLKKWKEHIGFISNIATRINSLKCEPAKYCSCNPNAEDNYRESFEQHNNPPSKGWFFLSYDYKTVCDISAIRLKRQRLRSDMRSKGVIEKMKTQIMYFFRTLRVKLSRYL